MAKPIPRKKSKAVKHRPIKKAKVEIAEEVLNARAQEEIKGWMKLTKVRGKIAEQAYEAQDKATQHVIDTMVDRMLLGANGLVRISPLGSKGESYAVAVSMKNLRRNALFIATEILKDFALHGFRIENYEFPDVLCTACGTALRPKGSKKPFKAGKKLKRG